MTIVVLFLAAIVAANLLAATFGPNVTVLNAFLFIGLNITARDRLHDAWRGSRLALKMGALIAAGAVLSYALNRAAGPIALASFVAFAASEGVDAAVYHRLLPRSWMVRVNGSNAVSAAVDSVIFPTLAFGALMPLIVLGQFAAKVLGGGAWSWVLKPKRARAGLPPLAALLLFAIPASGQTASVGLGEYHNEFVTQTVVEAVALFPAGFNAIISWDVHGDGKPVVLPQFGRDLISRFPVIIGADVGASAGPWDDYSKWEPHVSARALAFVHGRWKVISIMSWQPFNDWARAVVVKVDATLW